MRYKKHEHFKGLKDKFALAKFTEEKICRKIYLKRYKSQYNKFIHTL